MLFIFACEAAGASDTRLSLRPPFFEWLIFVHGSGATRVARSPRNDRVDVGIP
jgi:hypothetical protein